LGSNKAKELRHEQRNEAFRPITFASSRTHWSPLLEGVASAANAPKSWDSPILDPLRFAGPDSICSPLGPSKRISPGDSCKNLTGVMFDRNKSGVGNHVPKISLKVIAMDALNVVKEQTPVPTLTLPMLI
jgi:hypothetical protein